MITRNGDTPLKIAQILYSGLGGHGSVAFSLSAAAGGRWQQEMVFVGIEPLLPEYGRLCRERGFGQSYVPVAEGRAWSSWWALHDTLRDVRPDAIVLHSVKTLLPCWLYARQRGIPLVAVEHQPNTLKSAAEWAISHLLVRLADTVVLLTPAYREELAERLGRSWNEHKIVLIPNGIDTDRFKPTERLRDPGPIRVGMAARFSNRKRQDLLVEALSILNREDGPGAWNLSLSGDGDELPRIRERIAELGLEKAVTLPGYLGESELRDWFAALDIYAHASDGETLSTSLLQALACGLPILGSDVPGITNFLSQGGGVGLLVEAETPAAFASGLRRLAADRTYSERLAQNARRLACMEYGHATMFERYARLLEQ